MSGEFNMGDYNDVAARIRDFKEKHPEGCLQPADISAPYSVAVIGEKTFIVYTALAYRTPEDIRPGVGVAWEPFPGRSNFTRDSELQNAETSAWGRAIVAALAADTKKGVAAAEEVRNRQADSAEPPPLSADEKAKEQLYDHIRALPPEGREKVRAFCDERKIPRVVARMDRDQVEAVSAVVDGLYIAAAQDDGEAPQAAQERPEDPGMGDDTPEAPSEAPAHAPRVPNGNVDRVQAAIDTVAGMSRDQITEALKERDLSVAGNASLQAQRLAKALMDETPTTA